MTFGIVCTVVLGVIALWQTILAIVWRRLATKALADGCRERVAIWRAALEEQQVQMRIANARHTTFAAGIKRCQDPDVSRDIRARHRAIRDAAVAANRAAEDVRSAGRPV